MYIAVRLTGKYALGTLTDKTRIIHIRAKLLKSEQGNVSQTSVRVSMPIV